MVHNDARISEANAYLEELSLSESTSQFIADSRTMTVDLAVGIITVNR